MYAGNTSLVNIVMRWPLASALVAAVTAGAITVTPPLPVPAVSTPPSTHVTVPNAPPVLERIQPSPKSLETVCPPVDTTSKMKKQDKAALVKRGCKVKG